jgi:hypothetical protein
MHAKCAYFFGRSILKKMKNELNQYVEFFSQASLEINSTEETSQTRWIQTKKSSSM